MRWARARHPFQPKCPCPTPYLVLSKPYPPQGAPKGRGQFLSTLWHWGLVRNIWHGGPNLLHQPVPCLLHLHFCIHREVHHPLIGHRSTFSLMFGRQLMQANELPHKIMEEMRLRFVHHT